MNVEPINSIRGWYDQQPNEVRDAIALFVLIKAPRFHSKGLQILTDSQEMFLNYLKEIPNRTNAVIGEILFIRATIDFSVMRQFGNEIDWLEKKERNEAIAAEFEDQHGPNQLTQDLRKLTQSFPERQELWRKSATSWKILKNTLLSDEVLEAWEKANPTNFEESK